MTKVAKFIKWLGIGALLTGSVAGSFLWGPKLYTRFIPQTDANAKQNEARFVTVRRDDLQIMITEDGKLRAIKNHAIYPQLKGQNKISWLIPEGTSVKKGDKLIEFDKKPREEILRTKSADLEGQQRGVTVAEETLRIQISSSKASLRAAETKLRDAQVALRVYENLDGPKKLNDMDAAITDARAKHNTKIKDLADTQKKIDEQLFIEEQQRKALDKELAQAKESLDTVRKAVETAVLQQKTFRRYDYPQNLTAKKQAVETAQLDVDKASVAAKSEVNQKTQELAKINDSIRRLKQDIKELTDEMEKCILTAPTDGMVLYGDPVNPYRYYGGEQGIRVGMDWYGANTLMTIPDTTAFEIAMSIGEEYRGKVSPGAKATITVEAIPGLVIDGELKKIENLARNRVQWDPGSPKVFDATLLPSRHDSRMISGMTTRVEILAETVPNVLLVPLEAVFNEGGDPVCYVRKGPTSERRPVQPGKSNDHFVEIISGLTEAEQVDLTPQRAPGAGQNSDRQNGPKSPAKSQQPTTQPTTQPATMPTTQPATTQESPK